MIEFPLGMSLGRPYSFHLIFLRLKIANKRAAPEKIRYDSIRSVQHLWLWFGHTFCILSLPYVICGVNTFRVLISRKYSAGTYVNYNWLFWLKMVAT